MPEGNAAKTLGQATGYRANVADVLPRFEQNGLGRVLLPPEMACARAAMSDSCQLINLLAGGN